MTYFSFILVYIKKEFLFNKLRYAFIGSLCCSLTLAHNHHIISIKDAGVTVKACSHITGGGFYENIPRMLPEGMHAVVRKDSYEVPAIFKLLQKTGDIAEEMMYNTYNMGLGMIVAVSPDKVDSAMEAIKSAGDTPYVVGEIKAGEKGVTLC